MRTIRLICGDEVIVRVPQEYFDKSIFNNPEISGARSHTLQCKARSEVVNALLDAIDDDSEQLTITEDNFDELQKLCKELGFSGLDKQFGAFRGETVSHSVDLKQFLQLKERVTRQDKRLTEVQHQLNELLIWKRAMESEMREFPSLERKIEEVARLCEERHVQALRKTERDLQEFAKQRDLDTLAQDLAQLKQTEKRTVTESPTKNITTPTKEDEKRVATPSSHKRANRSRPTTQMNPKRDIFVVNPQLDGVIAALTRECGGNVHEKGIVNVTASSVNYDYEPKHAVDLGTDSEFCSDDKKNSWICYDFKDRRVIPTGYSVRSWSQSSGGYHPKNWVMEASNGKSWMTIDRRGNNDQLNGNMVIVKFNIAPVPRTGFRFFRLRLIGKNHDDNDILALSALEIFGDFEA